MHPLIIYILLAVLPFVALLLLTIGMGLILATVNVFFRDMEHLYGVFLMLLMWAMPIFYPANIVPESFRFIQDYNPLYAVISCCRDSFLYGTVYDPMQLLFAMISGIVALILNCAVLQVSRQIYTLHLIEGDELWEKQLSRLKMLEWNSI